mgnify:CR=1 FL=1
MTATISNSKRKRKPHLGNTKEAAPKLLLALEDYEPEGRAGLASPLNALVSVSTEDSPKLARAVVFVHGDRQAAFGSLQKQGVRVNRERGPIRFIVPAPKGAKQ